MQASPFGDRDDGTRALLVGFRLTNSQAKSLGHERNIVERQRDQLRAAERGCHPDCQEGTVPDGAGSIAFDRPEHVAQGVAVCSAFALWPNAVGTPDAGEHLTDRFRPGARLRRVEAGFAVVVADRCQASADR
ncbi:MAG: hypothetical protein ACRYG4_25705 [Janthinobacterium lividum]